jgi:3-hexulose-6-phosphate synthase
MIKGFYLLPSVKPKIMNPIVQISLDLTNIDEALETAAMAMRAGVDWLEAGTPLILAEGLHGVRKLREAFPTVPIVADLKTMDGGYLEAEMMAKAGATHVVVMARAHEETIKCVVNAGRDFGVKVMGDNLGCEDMVAAAKWLEELGCDFVIHHIGYDERRCIAARGLRMPSWRPQFGTSYSMPRIWSTFGGPWSTFNHRWR